MNLGLKGRTAVVFGASSGLGLASPEALREEGVDVVIVARPHVGTPREVGDVVCFLASRQASYLNGIWCRSTAGRRARSDAHPPARLIAFVVVYELDSVDRAADVRRSQ